MKTLNRFSLGLSIGLLTVAESAYGTQPPDVVQSDTNYNTAMGSNALQSLSTGTANTAAGFDALSSNTAGGSNTAYGYATLYNNTTGNGNTASGEQALYFNTSGNGNTASGESALEANTLGSNNSAFGLGALQDNTSGIENTACGAYALQLNSTGNDNTASGLSALQSNTTGKNNTASGYQALNSNVGGGGNTGSGYQALYMNANHFYNTALGYQALYKTNGHYNIGVGYRTGLNLTSGINNINIGNLGVAAESGVIRIGTSAQQTQAFTAGISNSAVTGAVVYVTSSGQLGVLASSERYKTAIAPIGKNTQKLKQLRPVTFHLSAEPHGPIQYGLIAEEVDKVYPELVIRDASGKIQGVRYDELAPNCWMKCRRRLRKSANSSSSRPKCAPRY